MDVRLNDNDEHGMALYAPWIKRCLQKPGKSATELAKLLKRGPDVVSKMVHGTRRPKASEIHILEAYLEEPAPRPRMAALSQITFTDVTSFDIVGWIARDVLFEHQSVKATDERFPQLRAPRSRKFPRARHFAYEIRDNSMDRASIALSAGSYALCVDMKETNQELQDGKIYIVRVDNETTYQVTCRRASVTRDHVEFAYKSSAPDLAETSPLRYPLPLPDNVTVIGRVFAAFMPDADEDYPRA